MSNIISFLTNNFHPDDRRVTLITVNSFALGENIRTA